MKKSGKKNNNNNYERHCVSCEVSEEEEQLFEISLPNEIPRSIYCKSCMDRLLDSSRKKREINK